MTIETMTNITSVVRSDRAGSETSATQVRELSVAAERQAVAEVKQQQRQQQQKEANLDHEDLEKAVSELKEYVQNVQRDLNFHVDDVTGRVVVKVIDAENDEVIRQIPPEEMLALSRRLAELMDENMQENASMAGSSTGILIEITA